MRGIDFAGFRLLSFADVQSTNDIARGIAAEGEPGDLVIMAESQSAGRGRHAREWSSPPGNLYASLLLRPATPLAASATLSLVIGLAMRNAIEELAPGTDPKLKWPNDIMIGRRKLAGILMEGESEADGSVRWLIAGSGVNLDSHPDIAKKPATSLKREGFDIKALDLLERYLLQFQTLRTLWLQDGFSAIKPQWMRHAFGAGRELTVSRGSEQLRGLFAGIDDGGNLRLMTKHGQELQILAGELAFDLEAGSD